MELITVNKKRIVKEKRINRFKNRRYDIESFRKRDGGRIKVLTKKCIYCGKRVRFHHLMCNKCWHMKNGVENGRTF